MCPALQLACHWVELGLSIEMDISWRALTDWYFMGLGGLWWSNVLNLALLPKRLWPDTWPEHQDPVSHTESMWLWPSNLTSLCLSVFVLIYKLVFGRDALHLRDVYFERFTVVNLPGTGSDFRRSPGPRWPSLVSDQYDLRHISLCFSILSLSYLLKQLACSPKDGQASASRVSPEPAVSERSSSHWAPGKLSDSGGKKSQAWSSSSGETQVPFWSTCA